MENLKTALKIKATSIRVNMVLGWDLNVARGFTWCIFMSVLGVDLTEGGGGSSAFSFSSFRSTRGEQVTLRREFDFCFGFPRGYIGRENVTRGRCSGRIRVRVAEVFLTRGRGGRES